MPVGRVPPDTNGEFSYDENFDLPSNFIHHSRVTIDGSARFEKPKQALQ
ncbi:MAG: hypothetical protein ACI8UO_002893 [Verrucomicrobiales bacterium]|jgi:hypothetical protein